MGSGFRTVIEVGEGSWVFGNAPLSLASGRVITSVLFSGFWLLRGPLQPFGPLCDGVSDIYDWHQACADKIPWCDSLWLKRVCK